MVKDHSAKEETRVCVCVCVCVCDECTGLNECYNCCP